ncbi:hypothetical protein H4W79_001807 [Nocardiopsis terrae]|uniref:PH domain-containing protein n=1 Tax=Nocardiopsis terrae TaxID=372655 RepID=A0ABR9HEY7_9ACTN|nr:hypothetical protein [Nocardiopsis terrae]MBE1457593.1 hypothetical protein [Nocardiopsis terrae]
MANASQIFTDGVVALILLLPFVSVLIWFIFKLCVFSGVDVALDRVTVRNFSTETDVEIGLIKSVSWSGGLQLVLKNGTRIRSVAFPDSLFSLALQYRNFRRVARAMDAEIKDRSRRLASVDSTGVQQWRRWDLSLMFFAGLCYFSLLLFSCFIFS